MPAQHRRTYGAIYEVMLASRLHVAALCRLRARRSSERLPAGRAAGRVTLFIAPVLVCFLIPESPRWLLRRGRPQAAVDSVNLIIRRCGSRVAPLTVPSLGRPGDGAR